MPFFDSSFLLLIPAFIFAIYAQIKVKSTYNKYKEIKTQEGFSGYDVVKKIFSNNNINDVAIESTPGNLTDHYDPTSKTLRLSEDNYYGKSIAALGVSAHEAGHALQHAQGYRFIFIRNAIYPVANFGSMLAFPLFFIGLVFFKSKFLMDLGIFLYIGAVFFTVATLPVEFDASKRALVQLSNGKVLTDEELGGAKKVLNAAALTYVAAAAMAIMQLVRLLILRSSSED